MMVSDSSAPVVGRGLVGERRPAEIIGDGDRDALGFQLGSDVIEAEREDVEHAAQQIDVHAVGTDAGTAGFAVDAAGSSSSATATAAGFSDRNHHRDGQTELPKNFVMTPDDVMVPSEKFGGRNVASACSHLQQKARVGSRFNPRGVSRLQHLHASHRNMHAFGPSFAEVLCKRLAGEAPDTAPKWRRVISCRNRAPITSSAGSRSPWQ